MSTMSCTALVSAEAVLSGRRERQQTPVSSVELVIYFLFLLHFSFRGASSLRLYSIAEKLSSTTF